MDVSITADKRIQHLHVRAPDETLAARGVRLMQDALRTASLRAPGARMLIVRRLNLGRFPADTSPQTLSLAVERQFAALDCEAVHALESNAIRAPAVWFRDALEAHTLLALRIAEGDTPDEWFWPLVSAEAVAAEAASDRLHAVVTALARLPEAPTALPHFVCALVAHGHAGKLVECLGDDDCAALNAAAGIASAGLHEPEPQPSASHDNRSMQPFVESPTSTPADVRVRWLQAMLAAAGVSRSEARRRLRTPAARVARAGTPRASHPAQPALDTDEAARNPPLSLNRPRASALRSCDTSPLEQPPWPSRCPTAAAGLLFLLPVLSRLNYGEWLRDHPEWLPLDITRRFFALVCTRIGVPEEDPVWHLARLPQGMQASQPQESLRDAVAGAWLSACRRWLRRHARVGLASLVSRPAQISITPTHVDVYFELAAATLAVRAAGLDLDPGWVPWFGRVVHFHYGTTDG